MTRSFYQYTLLMGTVSFLFTACGHKSDKPSVAPPVKVSVLTVQSSAHQQQFFYSGSIEADNITQIGFAVPGTVDKVLVQEGEQVKAGQLLASIDGTEYINSLTIANASLEQSQDLYERLNNLYQKGSLPAKDYMDVKTKLEQAKASRNLSAKRMTDSKLYAPVTGIITARLIERGSTTAPGVAAFSIAKTDMVYARITVPESEVGALQRGQNAVIYIPTLGDTLKGQVTIMNPQADNVSRTYSIKIKLSNNAGKLLPGMIADVIVQSGKQISSISIPSGAVLKDADDIVYVYAINQDNKVIRKRITTGRATGDNQVIITGGLVAGDKIVIAGNKQLADGSAVSY